MSSNGRNEHTPRNPSITAGLDDAVARLALNNSSDVSSNSPQKSFTPQPPPSGEATVAVIAQGVASVEDGSANSPRQRPPVRKRPNQAQRRQMNSQLSIHVDPHPVHSSSNLQRERQGPDQSGQYTPPPRHQHVSSHPQSNTGHSNTGHANTDQFISQQLSYSPWNAGGNHGPHHRPGYIDHEPKSHPSFQSKSRPHHGHRYIDHQPQSHPDFRSESRTPHGHGYIGHQPQSHPSFQSESRPQHSSNTYGHQYFRKPFSQEEEIRQSMVLDRLCQNTLPYSEITRPEVADKEAFRLRIESICRQVIAEHELNTNANLLFPAPSVKLACFGSLASGFATKASDMDLGLLSPCSKVEPDAPGSPIPRLLEKAFLNNGIGARLLSRTRVPIIKLCESPSENLLKGLLLQRGRWEAGLDQDNNDARDEHEQVGDQNVDAKDEEYMQQPEAEHSPTDFTTFSVPDEQGRQREFHIRQKPGQDLFGYCGLAKRVLRKAGGRDVNAFNARDFTPHDWTILNMVCRAFVYGISDVALRESLIQQLPSFAFDVNTGFLHNHSLLGVSVLAEGEQTIRMWRNWPLSSTLYASDPACETFISLWRGLQLKSNSSEGVNWYTKELQDHLERLKRIPSFQLLLFKQKQREPVVLYHERMSQVAKSLNVTMQNDVAVRREIIDKYIAGIFSKDVSNDMKSWQCATNTWDLGLISGKHTCLQLASDLEKALSESLYEASAAVDVSRYIQVLRGPLQEANSPSGYRTLIVSPDDPEANELLTTILSMPDPHGVTSSQPHNRYRDPLEFPKHSVGVQCDINFSAHLALENTALLRCYSCTDPRVRPMILFVKHWAKVRGINSGYRGTLSSYGYVLMVLHYLVNVASPFVCPNLQRVCPDDPARGPMICKGYAVNFWRDEAAIADLACHNRLNQNQQTVGSLLRGFFEYFGKTGPLSNLPRSGFDWGRDVLSLRSPGGLLTKREKGWTGAKTIYQAQNPNEPSAKPPTTATDDASGGVASHQAGTAAKSTAVKEVRLRYLFAIEDPFEIDHNVARTVTHDGIVSIRDEFRRAWSIIQGAGELQFFRDFLEDVDRRQDMLFVRTLYAIHGRVLFESDLE